MSQFFYIHPDNPQARLINQAVEIVRKGGVIVYPTDSGYALGCKIEDKGAMERICRIRQLPDGHNFTLMCRDLSELSTYAFVDNVAFRLMKNNTPGNYTFILKGTKEVPRRLLPKETAVNDEVHHFLQTIFDLFRVGFGKVAAGQHQRRGEHRLA